ncbi:TM2 domain-containing protein 2-like [Zootermopsis nevadensis]|uniref:TM2 domain-containing protein 2-like n=1 Tax=Zootermopsis nevadensis TaxID=136037 RepID=UPI000B8EBA40|nr:TM2 domain-containing protein 2-like [Zootermopsis nevadensis]
MIHGRSSVMYKNLFICLYFILYCICKTTAAEFRYPPHGPLAKCSFLPLEFIDCDPLIDHKGNKTAKEEDGGYGWVKFGGYRYEDVEKGKRNCTVLQDIECEGERTFGRDGFPCIK